MHRLSDANNERKDMLLNHIKSLNAAFSLDIAAFAIMASHAHIVIRLNPDAHLQWTDQEMVERWAIIHPPRNTHNQPIEDEQRYQRWVQDRLNDSKWLEQTREKLASPSQFMKDFKQFAAQTFNKLDQTVGHFWESRFRSIPLDDREAVLATMAYVDLNPFAAKLCDVPEQGEFTSLKERVESRQQEIIEPAETSNESSTDQTNPALNASAERHVWFAAIDESATNQAGDPGLFRGIRLDSYLKLVDGVARMVRNGKHHLDTNAEGILTRLKLCNRTFQDCFARVCYRMQFVT